MDDGLVVVNGGLVEVGVEDCSGWEGGRKVRVVVVSIRCKEEVVVEVLYKEVAMAEVENGVGVVENGMLVVVVMNRYMPEVVEVVNGVGEESVVEVVNCSSKEGVVVGKTRVAEVEMQPEEVVAAILHNKEELLQEVEEMVMVVVEMVMGAEVRVGVEREVEVTVGVVVEVTVVVVTSLEAEEMEVGETVVVVMVEVGVESKLVVGVVVMMEVGEVSKLVVGAKGEVVEVSKQAEEEMVEVVMVEAEAVETVMVEAMQLQQVATAQAPEETAVEVTGAPEQTEYT